MTTGRRPVTRARHSQWQDTPNIRVGTCPDAEALAGKCSLQVTDGFRLQGGQQVLPWPRLRASVAVFKLV